MSSATTLRRRSQVVLIAVLATALALALAAVGTQGDRDAQAAMQHTTTPRAATLTASQLRFHDQMRKLWEDHVT